MRHRKHRSRLGRLTGHRAAMMGNLVSSVLLHERVETTLSKAKEAREVVDRMITLGKDGSLHARRQAISVMRDVDAVHHLFAVVAPRFQQRQGGYTRIYKLGFRHGDAAPMALLEVLPAEVVEEVAPVEQRRTGLRGIMDRLRGRRGGEASPPTPAAPAAEGGSSE